MLVVPQKRGIESEKSADACEHFFAESVQSVCGTRMQLLCRIRDELTKGVVVTKHIITLAKKSR
ncbi:hypothetical protein B5P44_00440 [Mycobacterium sp. CBMA 213]|nr:hypothetical protein [Mycolicibacterium sp. CBMA 213]